ncbi:MAG TPA: hypothetical protein VI111_05365 [Thermoleophilaceae bacterium]
MTEPISPIGRRTGLSAVTPVQRRRPRDADDERREQEREQRKRASQAAPPDSDEPERLIDVEA